MYLISYFSHWILDISTRKLFLDTLPVLNTCTFCDNIWCRIMSTLFIPDTNVASLQRVKEMLRRLRWQQERSTVPHSHHKSPSIKTFVQQVASDLCKFVCGEKAGNPTLTTESSFSWEVEPGEMARALDDQQKKAEVS